MRSNLCLSAAFSHRWTAQRQEHPNDPPSPNHANRFSHLSRLPHEATRGISKFAARTSLSSEAFSYPRPSHRNPPVRALPSNPMSLLQPPNISRFLHPSPHGCERGYDRQWVPPELRQPSLATGPTSRQLRGRRDLGDTPAQDNNENGLRRL